MLESLHDILDLLLQSPYPVLVTVFAVVIILPLLRKPPKKRDKPVTPPEAHCIDRGDVRNQTSPTTNASIDSGGGAYLSNAHFSGAGGNNFGSNSTVNNNQDRSANTISGGSNNVITRGDNSTVSITKIDHQHVGKYGLDHLKEFVSFGALHDSSAQDPERCCHPGTRQNVLHRMHTWMDDPKAPERILWLHGPAGVGKSAIAQTISYSSGRDKVGATFFFFKSDPMRNDGNRLFPTLAWRLTSSIPIVKDLIAFYLEEDPDIPRKAIKAQFDQLIAQPFITLSTGESVAPTPSRVIIIDGLDECSDVKLQRRILKIIGNAVDDTHFPLRFVVSSRPEANIQDFFDQLQSPTLRIDLANIEDAFRDLEIYLTSEFARIAVEQGLDPEVWPGKDVIDILVSKSSGQFVYASTVVKYVGDEYEDAVTQLRVILGLKPSTGQSPFSELDALYIEILQRQSDKGFLKEFLPVLVARSMVFGIEGEDLHKDDAMLLGLERTQLHRKLRGLRSILKFEPFLDVHHKSFLDFLHDSSRSGEYHVSKHFAKRRYMELIVDILVKAAKKAMEKPDSHGSDHFQPRFAKIIQRFPLQIELPLSDLEKILQPLLVIQEKLLQLPHMSVPWKPRTCEDCWTFYMIDDLLLHLACLRGSTQLQELKYVGIYPLTAMEEKQNIPELDLDTCLSLLLAELRSAESQLSLNMNAIGLVRALIRFDPIETAMKVQSMADAQNLVELIFCLNRKECFTSWFGASAHNATRLALAIYGRMPVPPRSLFLDSADLDSDDKTYQGKAVIIMIRVGSVWRDCFSAFMWGNGMSRNMLPEWRRSTNYSVSKIQAILFEVAKAIQYIHSFGISLNYAFNGDDVYLDSYNQVKLWCPHFVPNDLCEGQFDYDGSGRVSTLENDIRKFGLLFHQILFNDQVSDIPKTKPETPDNVWQLIQWCCTDEPERRPTIDQVIQEMESWISLGQFTLLT